MLERWLGEVFRSMMGAYDEMLAERTPPDTSIIGFRNDDEVVRVVLGRGTGDLREWMVQFTLAGALLDACEVEGVCLVTGDPMGHVLLDERDVPSQFFLATLVSGDEFQGGLVAGCTMSSDDRWPKWGKPARVDHSLTSGWWAETIVPLCFVRKTPPDVAYLVASNDEAGNLVLRPGPEGGVIPW